MSFAIIEKVLKQDAIYWAPASVADGRGDRSFDAPVAIRCRWDGTNEERMDNKGVRFITTASVMVDRDVVAGGVLRQGTLDDYNNAGGDPTEPLAVRGCALIRNFAKTPTLKADKYVRTAFV